MRKEPQAKKGKEGTIETTRSKEMDSPLRAARGNSPANTLTLAHWNWFGTSDLQNCTWEEMSKENLTENKMEPGTLEEGHLGTEVSRIEYSGICIASI